MVKASCVYHCKHGYCIIILLVLYVAYLCTYCKCSMCGISCLSVYEPHTRVHLQHEADGALRKARLLQAQRQEEYEKAKVSTSRLEEEQIGGGGGAAAAKQLEKRRRLEEEALQKVQLLLRRLLWALNSSHIAFKNLFCISFLFVKVCWFLTLHFFGVFKSAFFFPEA